MATKVIKKDQQKKKPTLDEQLDSIIKIDGTLELEQKDTKFPIVGIGASAGGLAAFEAFFSGMPTDEDTDMAFVLIQHLAPDHESALTEIIKRYTTIQVFEATDGMTVMPNCTYIIPPNCDMAFLNGSLHLFERSTVKGGNMSIDFFFQSLADDQHEQAICIILSGTGIDGTVGLKHIKAEGGLVIVQNPETTTYDGMPKSAISTGLVDYILSPSDMVKQLISYTNHIHSAHHHLDQKKPENEENAIKKVFVLLRSHTGHDFSKYKPSTINRRIERRLAVNQIDSMENYTKFLQKTPSEIDALFYDLLIGVTNFFRDKDAFSFLETEVIPKFFTGKPIGSEIRVWCVGCSTGEEAYSLAILLHEGLENINSNYDIKIFATDIDNHAISNARSGLYSNNIKTDVSPERLAKYFKFDSKAGAYRINKNIRDMLIFSEQNVIKDPPFSRLDLITCRNLMIYLNNDLQKKIVPLFHYSLNPNGILFLGSSETIGDYNHLFIALDRKLKIYLRKDDYQDKERKLLNMIIPKKNDAISEVKLIESMNKSTFKQSLREITEQSIIKESTMAGILVDDQGNILFLHGRTGMYLEPSPGEAAINNIFKMAREGLKKDLTEGFRKVVVDKTTVRKQNISVKTNGHFSRVNMVIKQIGVNLESETKKVMYVVMLDESQIQESQDVSNQIIDVSSKKRNIQLEELKTELRIKEEYLQSTNEELETANEELKSSNEEMQSVNEELQSTNEELETSKEELQSINEELITVNSELLNKVQRLSEVNNDMNNLLAGTNIATVFLDLKQNILRFTPSANRIINLIPTDVGRPISHIVSNLVNYNELSKDVKTVLDTLTTKTINVKTLDDKWYAMIIQPYRTVENVIEGAVVTFIDITEEKIVKDKLTLSELKYRSLFETTKEGIVIVDGHSGKVQDVNPYLIELLGYSKIEFLEKEIWNIGFFSDIAANKDKFIELKKQKSIRYHNLPLETVSGKKIEVEFIGNTYEINDVEFIQCNIRKMN